VDWDSVRSCGLARHSLCRTVVGGGRARHKRGDLLLEINGESTGTYVPYSLWSVHNPNHYRAEDPYFLHILSNRGDSDVDLVIKSAEKGKKFKFKMRPRSDDRYLYVDSAGAPFQKTTEPPK